MTQGINETKCETRCRYYEDGMCECNKSEGRFIQCYKAYNNPKLIHFREKGNRRQQTPSRIGFI